MVKDLGLRVLGVGFRSWELGFLEKKGGFRVTQRVFGVWCRPRPHKTEI